MDVIAIDGPAASGKSTVARGLAAKLDSVYVDSGSVYRGVTWLMLQSDLELKDEDAVLTALAASEWEFYVNDNNMSFQINGVHPGTAIRTDEVTHAVSTIAAQPGVRSWIVAQLRGMVRFGSLVMEGRDIGSVVFPDASHKFYLDADPAERARRRSQQNQQLGETEDVEKVHDALQRRDAMDSQRKTAPLQIPLGATVVNSTGLDAEQTVQKILEQVQG